MKKIAFLFVLVFGLTAGCDYIDDPIQGGEGGGGNPTDSLVQKVLVEDYTGHNCPNCPDAATEADNLKAIYGDQVVVVAVHAGFFAQPTSSLPTDFRTTAGEAMNSFFGFLSYPSGMVNRIGYPGQHVLNFQAWPPAVADALLQTPLVDLNIEADFTGNTITADVEVIYQTDLDGDYALVLWITEDGIIAPQKNGVETIPDYEHNHVLRTSLNSTWGDTISSGPVEVLNPYNKSYSTSWNAEWNEQNCHVVAFLYDMATFEVLQVEEISL